MNLLTARVGITLNAMSSLQRLLGKDDTFCELLEAAAAEARSSVLALVKYLQTADAGKTLHEFVTARRKEKAITLRIREGLCTNFVSTLDRHDIEDLAHALYRIPKTVENLGEHLALAPQHLRGTNLQPPLGLLEEASQLVLTMTQMLRHGATPARIKPLNDKLQAIEGQADKMVLIYVRSIYNGQGDLPRALFLRDVHHLIEKVTDRCRDAGNILSRIALKNT
jgi:uncharacterized protein Yka (UPF0111/DUF47 family)